MKLIVVAHFEANRTYIAQNLCENRNKPELHCKGKCYLKKQLKKEEKNESASNIWKAKSETLFVEKHFEPIFCWLNVPSDHRYFYLTQLKSHFYHAIFQPPQNGFHFTTVPILG